MLNNANGGIPISAGGLITGGEPFAPGTRMEFTDEFLAGYDREFKGGVVASVRYIDRRLKRVIEDQGGISVEQFNALAYNGGGLNYYIGNPNAKQDIFVNPNELLFSQGRFFTPPTDSAGNVLALTPANEGCVCGRRHARGLLSTATAMERPSLPTTSSTVLRRSPQAALRREALASRP